MVHLEKSGAAMRLISGYSSEWGWPRHTFVVAALALVTTLAMGVAAAGGMSVLASDDSASSAEQPGMPAVPPVVVAPEPERDRPDANPARRAPHRELIA
ncbi:MAG TPA: hypothetical protein VE172_16555, partial [Stackebrandtia sp.]|nr:hypothetical protein [Stackebrandtia sp.]